MIIMEVVVVVVVMVLMEVVMEVVMSRHREGKMVLMVPVAIIQLTSISPKIKCEKFRE